MINQTKRTPTQLTYPHNLYPHITAPPTSTYPPWLHYKHSWELNTFIVFKY